MLISLLYILSKYLLLLVYLYIKYKLRVYREIKDLVFMTIFETLIRFLHKIFSLNAS